MRKITIIFSLIVFAVSCYGRVATTQARKTEILSEKLCGYSRSEEFIFTQFPLIGNTIGFVRARYEWWNHENREASTITILNDNGTVWHSFDVDTYELAERRDEWNDDFRPWAFEPTIGIFAIRVIAKSENYYVIVVNEEKNLVKRLKKHNDLKFETIEEHLIGLLIDTYPSLNPIRETPNDNALIMHILDDMEVLTAVESKGEWIKVADVFTDRVLGWIRWRKDDRFMIWMFYSM